jgi:hypothetical protein
MHIVGIVGKADPEKSARSALRPLLTQQMGRPARKEPARVQVPDLSALSSCNLNYQERPEHPVWACNHSGKGIEGHQPTNRHRHLGRPLKIPHGR